MIHVLDCWRRSRPPKPGPILPTHVRKREHFTQLTAKHRTWFEDFSIEKNYDRHPCTCIAAQCAARLSSKLITNSRRRMYVVRSNILNNIRNQYAFHHPYNAEVDTAFATAAPDPEFDDEWNWYLA
jgi:hypothetical protein